MYGQSRVFADAVRLESGDGGGVICPECHGNRFDLQLGGRNSGRIECSNCGFPLDPGRSANDPHVSAGR